VLTGEHGVGVEKRDLMGAMFTETISSSSSGSNAPSTRKKLLNPGKVFPVLHRCAELGRMHVHKGALPFPSCRASEPRWPEPCDPNRRPTLPGR
jgi:glycolate oxidase